MPATPAEVFAVRLRSTRKGQKLSQSDLADLSGLTPAAISQLEAGDRLPAFKTLSRVAKALKTSVSFLLGEDSSAIPPQLQAFFRDLEKLEAEDQDKVRDYAAFLRAQSEPKSK